MNSNIDYEDYIDILIYNQFTYNMGSDNLLKISKQYNISSEYIIKRFQWLKSMGINPNIIHLKYNHDSVYEIFDNLNLMFNKNNIEYYYTSGILSYLLVGKELERFHHDLDIFVNMDDLEKLEDICKTYNFTFKRVIGNRDSETKRVMLKMYYNKISEIPITIFMYTKENDGSIIQYDYFWNLNEDEYVEQIYNSPEISKLSFSNLPHYHNNIKFYSITLEALYLCKCNNRPKDIYDCKQFENKINSNRLNELKQAFNNNKPNIIQFATDNKYYDFVFTKYYKQKVLKK